MLLLVNSIELNGHDVTELWRARKGAYNSCKLKRTNSGTSSLSTNFMMNLLVVLLILILLVIGGIEINPGPISPTVQLVLDKLGKFDITVVFVGRSRGGNTISYYIA